MDKYILTIKKEDLKKWPIGTDMNSCLTNLCMLNSEITYYESTFNSNTYELILRCCDIIAFDVSEDILLSNSLNEYLRIKNNKKYLLCIPLISFQLNDIYINTLNNNIKVYHFYLYYNFRSELAQNFFYFTDIAFTYYGRLCDNVRYKIDSIIFIPNHTKELFEKTKKKADYINEFERLMEPIKKVLLNSNIKLSNRNRLVLFLLRHHAIPPKYIEECNDIESILEH